MEIWDHLRSWIHRKEAEKFTTDDAGKTAVNVTSSDDISILTVEFLAILNEIKCSLGNVNMHLMDIKEHMSIITDEES